MEGILLSHPLVPRAHAGSVLGLAANVVCVLSVMVQPYMPNVSKQMQEQLQVRWQVG